MYNLIVGSNDGSLPRRFEYFSGAVEPVSNEPVDADFFIGIPTLVIPELGDPSAPQVARIGGIRSIDAAANRINFDFVPDVSLAPIPSRLVVENARAFGFDPELGEKGYRPWELHRTHWVVKDVDLYEGACRIFGSSSVGLTRACTDFESILLEQNTHAEEAFSKARTHADTAPADAVLRANMALESIVKTIAEDKRIGMPKVDNWSSSKLVKELVNRLGLAAGGDVPKEVKTISTSLMGLADAVAVLRSDRTDAHGKVGSAYMIDDPLWAELVVNASATLGLFLWRYYKLRLGPATGDGNSDE